MSKKINHAARLDAELEQMGDALRRIGAISADDHVKLTMRDLAIETVARAKIPTPREIAAIRETARLSQALFARLLDVSTSTVAKWERGAQRPRGPAARMLALIQKKGIDAVL